MRAKRRAFTLIELLIVMVIIGILIALIVKASMGGIRNAEIAATTSLIAKLETALTDRIDALSSTTADPNATHQNLAGIWTGSTTIASNQRAAVIARFDYLRAELPDVFVVDTSNSNYPLNFASSPFPPGGTTAANHVLPLGHAVDIALGGSWVSATGIPPTPGTGIYGASYAARGALCKQLGFGPKGTDGADNDGDGLADERDEGNLGLPADQVAQINQRLLSHKHKTSRSEVAYAILVEGTGPMGSVFSKDDFSSAEVRDTDNDGMLEFVDAWGEPLQFYRWPIMYRSDVQKGFPDLAKLTQDAAAGYPPGPYSTVYEPREQNPLDPNQALQNPGWCFATPVRPNAAANSSYPWGSPQNTFAGLFHTLIDPLAATAAAPSNVTYWDRSTSAGAGFFSRRAYYSRFLILSGGPDKQPGVARLSTPNDVMDYRSAYGPGANGIDERPKLPLSDGTYVDHTNLTGSTSNRDASGAPVPATAANVIAIENQAGRIDPNRNAAGCPPMAGTRNDTNTLLEEAGQDDISNHNLHTPGGPMPSSN